MERKHTDEAHLVFASETCQGGLSGAPTSEDLIVLSAGQIKLSLPRWPGTAEGPPRHVCVDPCSPRHSRLRGEGY